MKYSCRAYDLKITHAMPKYYGCCPDGLKEPEKFHQLQSFFLFFSPVLLARGWPWFGHASEFSWPITRPSTMTARNESPISGRNNMTQHIQQPIRAWEDLSHSQTFRKEREPEKIDYPRTFCFLVEINYWSNDFKNLHHVGLRVFFGISEMVSDEEIERKNEEVHTEKG